MVLQDVSRETSVVQEGLGFHENFSIPSTKVRNIFLVFGDRRAFILLVGLFCPVGWDMLTAYKVEHRGSSESAPMLRMRVIFRSKAGMWACIVGVRSRDRGKIPLSAQRVLACRCY